MHYAFLNGCSGIAGAAHSSDKDDAKHKNLSYAWLLNQTFTYRAWTLQKACKPPMNTSKKIILPRIIFTRASEAESENSTTVVLNNNIKYYTEPILDPQTLERIDGEPRWMKSQFNLFPLVLDPDGSPWAEAAIYIMSRVEETTSPVMSTFWSIADDLSSYRQFLNYYSLDWTVFPQNKTLRPTYRFNGHLKIQIQAGEISSSTARRRMGAVIAFYRWMMSEDILKTEYPAWKEGERYFSLKDSYGIGYSKVVKTTDLSIKSPKTSDPNEESIDDGGKLRPLPIIEQKWLMHALMEIGNTEMTLIHLIGLTTGARIQTILTLRVSSLNTPAPPDLERDVRVPVGPGTKVDTKNNKALILYFPGWLYEKLQIYKASARFIKRLNRYSQSDCVDPYIFLSRNGSPMYTSKIDNAHFDKSNNLRHSKSGQAVRVFIYERVLPYIRSRNDPNFHYRFHDTRASFGMNLTDDRLALVASGKIDLIQAREYVKARMGHESSATTDRYLNYRGRLKFSKAIQQNYGQHLRYISDKLLSKK